jgi:hypothetical protein
MSRVRVVSFNLAGASDGSPQWQSGGSEQLRRSAIVDELERMASCTALNERGDSEPNVSLTPTVPVICVQESILGPNGIPGFERVGEPARTHAGLTELYVPDEAWRRRHGVLLEVAQNVSPPNGFPMAALLLPTDPAMSSYQRVIIASVHLRPFAGPGAAAKRSLQLQNTAEALARVNTQLRWQLKPEFARAGQTNSKSAVERTLLVIAGDCNMRGEEDGVEQSFGFTDAFADFARDAPQLAFEHRWTWDTSTGFNGPPGPRGNYCARYDRIFHRVVCAHMDGDEQPSRIDDFCTFAKSGSIHEDDLATARYLSDHFGVAATCHF